MKKETFIRYLQKHFSVDQIFGAEEKTDGKQAFNQFTLPASKRLVLTLLMISPYLCGAGFLFSYGFKVALSLEWEMMAAFNGVSPTWLNLLYYTCVSGLIGYGTNWLAIRMLFRPIQKRPIWGQGLIPAQRERIILSLAAGMHTHILSQERIHQRIAETGLVKKINELILHGSSGLVKDEELRKEVKSFIHAGLVDYAGRAEIREEIREIVDVHLEENLEGGVKKFLLQTYKRYNKEDYHKMIDRVVQDVPNVTLKVLERLETQLDELAELILKQKATTEASIYKVLEDFLERIDITGLLVKQMENFDEVKLERMVRDATNEELKYIQYLGTVLGVLGGLLIAAPEITGPIYLGVLGLLWLADTTIFKFRNKATASSTTQATASD
jgi:uncharacterized membrane protein YheB (UPF0754 family)